MALATAMVSSFAGGCIGIVLIVLLAPIIADYALSFGSAEYFMLMLFGLIAASSISSGSAAKGLAMVVLGILFGVVGVDVYTGSARFTFGSVDLAEGISLIPLAMGMFGVAEILAVTTVQSTGEAPPVNLASMRPTREDLKRIRMPILRGSSIGSFFGTLPGTGPTVASFIAYATEVRLSRRREEFGKGAIEGVAAPEAANNSADQTSFIPTLSLGVPGSPTMALMLGAMMIHGIAPGPTMLTDHADVFWGLIMSFWIGNVLLIFLSLPLIGLWVRLLKIPYHYLYPAVLVFICIGTYSVHNSVMDVWLVVFFGGVGYLTRVFGYPTAPVLLGFVLGPLMEEHFLRAMLLSQGNVMTFVERPISGTIFGIVILLLLWVSFGPLLRKPKLHGGKGADQRREEFR